MRHHGFGSLIEGLASSVAVTGERVTFDVDGLDRLGDEANFRAPAIDAEGERLRIVALIEPAAIERAKRVGVLDAGRPTFDQLARRFAQPPNGFAVISRCLPNHDPHAAIVA